MSDFKLFVGFDRPNNAGRLGLDLSMVEAVSCYSSSSLVSNIHMNSGQVHVVSCPFDEVIKKFDEAFKYAQDSTNNYQPITGVMRNESN